MNSHGLVPLLQLFLLRPRQSNANKMEINILNVLK